MPRRCFWVGLRRAVSLLYARRRRGIADIMPSYEVIFPAQRITVDANDPQEAARVAAYELARLCEQGALAQVARARESTTQTQREADADGES